MALENLVGTDKFITSLINTNPTGGDDKREGDDHLRGIKNVLLNTFPALSGAVTVTPAQMNAVTNKVDKGGDVMTGNLQAPNISVGGVAPNNGAIFNSGGTGISQTYSGSGNTTVNTLPYGVGLGGGLLIIRGYDGSTGGAYARIYGFFSQISGGAGGLGMTQMISVGAGGASFTMSQAAGKITLTAAGTNNGNWWASFIGL